MELHSSVKTISVDINRLAVVRGGGEEHEERLTGELSGVVGVPAVVMSEAGWGLCHCHPTPGGGGAVVMAHKQQMQVCLCLNHI